MFLELLYLAALDYSRAFDDMKPEISGEVLRQVGFPEDIVNVLLQVWMRQERYIQYDGYTAKTPLETDEAHPQGGPFGPPLMQLRILAGAIWTNKEAGPDENTEPSIREQPTTTKRKHQAQATVTKKRKIPRQGNEQGRKKIETEQKHLHG